jgi:hypothetical protein
MCGLYEEVRVRASGRLALVVGVDGDAREVVVDGVTGTHRVPTADLEPTGVRLERSDIESLLDPSPWRAQRYPPADDTLDTRPGAHARAGELATALERLLAEMEHEDLGFPWMATRRESHWQLRIEADRWGLLVLARDALRLAASADRGEAHFDAGTYLEEFEDVFTLVRVKTPPRWWWDEPPLEDD